MTRKGRRVEGARAKIGARRAQKLTVRIIRQHDQVGILWDSDARGLGLRTLPSGLRVWVLRFKAGGRRRIVSLGSLSELALEEARTLAENKRAELRLTGKDPFAPRGAATVGEVADDYLKSKRLHVKSSTLAKYEETCRLVRERLGPLPVEEMDEPEVAKAFDRWTQDRGPIAANQALRLEQATFKLAVQHRLRSPSASNFSF